MGAAGGDSSPSGPVAGGGSPNHHPDAARLVRQIAEGEGTTDATARLHGFESGYDVPYGFGKYSAPDHPLTQMTLAEVKRYQRQQIASTRGKVPGTNKGTSAVGKYQVLLPTLEEAQKALGLSNSDVFDQVTQDKIGAYLLEKRGYSKYRAGKMSKVDFQRALAKEWASIADPDTGKSFYGQATGTTLDELEEALRGA